MDVSGRFTVFFDDPFWVGIYERVEDGGVEASRVVFGPEPKDYEVFEYLLKNWNRLRFGPQVQAVAPTDRRINPKRMQRKIKGELSSRGTGTKAQEAIKQLYQEVKQENRMASKQKKIYELSRKFEIRQIKKKEKHKGR